MKKLVITILSVVSLLPVFAQEETKTPYIEVVGTAETEVIPDMIYISINILERMENREKITVESQEKQLKEGISKINIDLKNLTLSDANSNYVKIRWGKKDVIKQSEYTLLVGTAEEVSKVFQLLDELKIKDARISKTDHSKIYDLRKETRIKAMKLAKEKAQYLLEAIDEKPGVPLIVRETSNRSFGNVQGFYLNEQYVSNNEYRSAIASINEKEVAEISFEKIKITASYYIKYAIAK